MAPASHLRTGLCFEGIALLAITITASAHSYNETTSLLQTSVALDQSSVVAEAERFVDVTNLSPPDGRFELKIREAVAELAQSGKEATAESRGRPMALNMVERQVIANHVGHSGRDGASTSEGEEGSSTGLIIVMTLIVVLLFVSVVLAVFSMSDGKDPRRDSSRGTSGLLSPGGGRSVMRSPQMVTQAPQQPPGAQQMGKRSPALATALPATSQSSLGFPNAMPGGQMLGAPVPPVPNLSAGSLARGGPVRQSSVPPICPSLILPRTQARFTVSMESLRRGTPLEIKGTWGRTLLEASIRDVGGGRRRLQLASVGCEDEPRTVVTNAGQGRGLEVCGKGEEVYGMLVPDPSSIGSSVLYCNQRPVMRVLKGSAELSFTASDMDGAFLGSCGGGAGGGGEQPWSLQVEPGEDAVLIASCTLGLILL